MFSPKCQLSNAWFDWNPVVSFSFWAHDTLAARAKQERTSVSRVRGGRPPRLIMESPFGIRAKADYLARAGANKEEESKIRNVGLGPALPRLEASQRLCST